MNTIPVHLPISSVIVLDTDKINNYSAFLEHLVKLNVNLYDTDLPESCFWDETVICLADNEHLSNQGFHQLIALIQLHCDGIEIQFEGLSF